MGNLLIPCLFISTPSISNLHNTQWRDLEPMHMLDKTVSLVQARTGTWPDQLNQSLSQSLKFWTEFEGFSSIDLWLWISGTCINMFLRRNSYDGVLIDTLVFLKFIWKEILDAFRNQKDCSTLCANVLSHSSLRL